MAAIASFAVCFCCGWLGLWVDVLTVFAVVTAALLIGDSPLSLLLNGFAVVVRQGQALRTGHRSSRGVAQDVPFFIAARLERRAEALTETGTGYEGTLERAM
jgi:UPF0716 family protein affecting phage T7 exclusion